MTMSNNRKVPDWTRYDCPFCGAVKGDPCVNEHGQQLTNTHLTREPVSRMRPISVDEREDRDALQALTNAIVAGNGW